MKAMILGAGFGTRLRPYTEITPKPLFTINGQPVIARTIRQLTAAGCSEVIINTHHLHNQIEAYLSDTRFDIPVTPVYEPEILDTGGGIRNALPLLGNDPFIVVNGDVVTDIDYRSVYDFHQSHSYPVTLVLHDYPRFNRVSVNDSNMITGFHLENCPNQKLAFTGIQVVDPKVAAQIPEKKSFSSITLYKNLIKAGDGVKAFTKDDLYWADIGTPESYSAACIDLGSHPAFGEDHPDQTETKRIKGDGSDRNWYRLRRNGKSVILGDHGISNRLPSEAGAFVKIGSHLKKAGLAVPDILHADTFAGHVYVADLGDKDLATAFKTAVSETEAIRLYQKALKNLAALSVYGGEGFLPSMTWQTPTYDKALIIEKECNYFINAFVNGFTSFQINPEDLYDEFSDLADAALRNGVNGFMHRDCQSRNIMVTESDCIFIDFQGGRIGPVQYDLASLMIDPYTGLSDELQTELVDYFIREFDLLRPVNRERFLESYQYLKLTRNLQMLGAFGFLSRVKGKAGFAEFIPAAIDTLKKNIASTAHGRFTKLKKLIEQF